MKRFFKIFSYLIVLVVVLAAAGVAAFVFTFNPNDHKAEIADQVQKYTGRTLTLEGDIKLAVFPWLGLELGAARLSNAEGFGDAPFASVEGMDVRVKLLPLFKKQLEMDTLTLHGLRLNLARSEKGVNNWDDLIAASAPQEKQGEQQGPPPELAALAIGGVDLRDGEVVWDDRQQKVRYAVSALDLSTGPISPGAEVDLKLESDLSASAPQLAAHVAFAGRLGVTGDGKRVSVSGMALDLSAQGAGLPGGSVEGRVRADLQFDLAAGALELKLSELNALGVPLKGEVSAAGLNAKPTFKGQLASAPFDPRPLMALAGRKVEGDLGAAALDLAFGGDLEKVDVSRLHLSLGEVLLDAHAAVVNPLAKLAASGAFDLKGVNPRALLAALGEPLPETTDSGVLSRLTASGNFSGGLTNVAIEGLKMGLDDTHLAGTLKVSDFKGPAVGFDLEVDAIDVDRYLPPPAGGNAAAAAIGGFIPPASAAPAASPATPIPLPLETLRTLRMAGKLHIQSLKINNLRLSDVRLSADARDGVVRLVPAAQLYGGLYQGNIGIDARGKTAAFSADEKLSGVQIGPLLKDLNGDERITGSAELGAKVTTAGLDVPALKRGLNGTATFRFLNGALNGINIGYELRKAQAALKGQPAPAEEASQTDFTEMGGTATIRNGVVHNPDFAAKSPLLRVLGEGDVDLPQERIDYHVKVSVVGTTKGQGGRELEQLSGLTIPLRIVGDLYDPAKKLDLGEVLKEKAKQEVKEKVEQRIEEKLKDKVGDDVKKKLLNKIFGR